MDRGYPKESTVRFVSDHYRLPEAKRHVLIRVVMSSDQAASRRAKKVDLQSLRGKDVAVDGYNVLITIESLLGGEPVYRCDDGFLRDIRGIFRTYKSSDLTDRALSLILDYLGLAEPSRVIVLLDQQISLSGRLAARIREMMREREMSGSARTAKDVDYQLKASKSTVATSDGHVIDVAPSIVDLPAEVAKGCSIKLQAI